MVKKVPVVQKMRGCGSVVKNVPVVQDMRVDSVPGLKIPRRKKWQTTPTFLLRKFHGQMSLMDYSP